MCNQGLDIEAPSKDHMLIGNCVNNKHGYLGELYGAKETSLPNEYTCRRTFNTPTVFGHLDADTDKYTGYDMVLPSVQYDNGIKPKTVLTLSVRCDKKDDGEKVNW